MDWGSYDGSETAGYRDVALNLRLCTAAALELGVELHVCEVQLLLRRFAEIKVTGVFVVLLYLWKGGGREKYGKTGNRYNTFT